MGINLPWDLGRKVVPVVHKTSAPATTDTAYNVPTLWINDSSDVLYVLVDVTSGVATWRQLQTNISNMTTSTDPAANAATTAAIVAAYSGVIITTTTTGNSQTLASPAVTTAGRTFTVVNNDTSTNSIPIVANSVTFTVTPGEAQMFIWDGTAWGPIDMGITEIPVPVTQGGTGRSTGTTAYSLVATGTTAKGAQQTLANGATTDILVGGGANALPVWTTATGSGAPVRATSPTLVTPVLGTPTSGDLRNCSAATDALKGVVELATNAETLAGTDTSRITTPAGVAGALAVLAREPDQGVAMTAATSGSNGIAVADDDNIDYGTGNFFGVIPVLLDDYTPAAEVVLEQKTDGTNGREFTLQTNGKLRVTINTTDYDSTVATGCADNTKHVFGYSVTRETAAAAGSIIFVVDGVQLGDAVAITAGAPTTINNTVSQYVLGTSATRTAGRVNGYISGNRALTAAEHLALYRNGIAFADKWGSQTAEIITPGTGNRNLSFSVDAVDKTAFNAAYNWVMYGATGSVSSGVLSMSAGANDHGIYISGVLVPGTKYRITLNVSAISGAWGIKSASGVTTLVALPATTGVAVLEFTASDANIRLYGSAGATISIDAGTTNNSCRKLGATLALEDGGIQPAGANSQWLDSSSNKLNATLPNVGATNTRKIDSGRYVWSTAMTDDTTWTSILPAGFVLEKVIFNNSTANACELRLGTSAGGTQMAATITIAASTFTTATIDKVVSLTADTTLYLSDTGAGWNSASLTATLFFRRFN